MERYTPPESASMSAHTRDGFAGETASPILPSSRAAGRRCAQLVQWAPPSVV